MSQPPPRYVLDTSALLTLIEDEAGADDVQALLEQAKRGEVSLLISFISFMEVYYISLQERGQEEAHERLRLMAALPMLRVESTETLTVLAGQLKAAHRLSVADAWIAALAQERDATLVHKDPEFEQLEATVKVLKLPYKKNTIS
ncbi:MAG: type II toxin-antitoxin system VapC family toxin [Deltaproteobacteria bacterium]|nr:type II toxin-antitoxin system VapC family toxin [Deltaproteobacteria bacterium]